MMLYLLDRPTIPCEGNLDFREWFMLSIMFVVLVVMSVSGTDPEKCVQSGIEKRASLEK